MGEEKPANQCAVERREDLMTPNGSAGHVVRELTLKDGMRRSEINGTLC